MKTFDDVMKEVRTNDELREKLVRAFDEEKPVEFFNEEGVDATEEDVKDFLYRFTTYQPDDSKLSDDQLEKVAGGSRSREERCTVTWQLFNRTITLHIC